MAFVLVVVLLGGDLASSSTRHVHPETFTAKVFAQEKPEKTKTKKGKGTFTIGKETTFVTGPLDKDGYIDYAAALNDRLRQGVTPDNNANVLIWKALGPNPEGVTVPEGFFQHLGMQKPPKEGEYFIGLSHYAKEHLKLEPGAAIDEDLKRCLQRTWTPKDYPNLASWLKANEKPLALLLEATKRTHSYSPILPPKTDLRPSGLSAAPLPGVQKCREIANALVARALLRAGQGQTAAWQDLLACHRLARLAGHGHTPIEGLVAVAIDGIASKADLVFLDHTQPNAKEIETYLRDLRSLPDLFDVADKVDLSSRLLFLEMVMMVDRHGLKYLEAMASRPPEKASSFADRIRYSLADHALDNMDWNPALQNANRLYDRLVTTLREKDRSKREMELDQFEAELNAIKKRAGGDLGAVLLGENKQKGKVVSEVLISLLVPAVHKVQNAADRASQIENNVLLAFALARYQRDQGSYPKELAMLTPKYLKEIPQDLFSGKALAYRPQENGYFLYSVGVNGKDEQGRGYEDNPPGDDLSVRMPLPPLPRR
jgi:hypothetical protein